MTNYEKWMIAFSVAIWGNGIVIILLTLFK